MTRLAQLPHLTEEECELLLHGLARIHPDAWFAHDQRLRSFLPDEIETIGGSLATALREAIANAAPAPDNARLEAATAALAARWYEWPDGPPEHGWMRELAAAALAGADRTRT